MNPKMKIWYFHDQNESDTHCLPAFFVFSGGNGAWHGRNGGFFSVVEEFFLEVINVEIYMFETIQKYEMRRNYAMHCIS